MATGIHDLSFLRKYWGILSPDIFRELGVSLEKDAN